MNLIREITAILIDDNVKICAARNFYQHSTTQLNQFSESAMAN